MRHGISHESVRIVYETILKLGNPTMVQIRRTCPQYCSTAIYKSVAELMDMQLVTKDGQWPPRYTAHGKVGE